MNDCAVQYGSYHEERRVWIYRDNDDNFVCILENMNSQNLYQYLLNKICKDLANYIQGILGEFREWEQ